MKSQSLADWLNDDTSLAGLIRKAQMDGQGIAANPNALETMLARLVSIDTSSSHNHDICKSNIELVRELKNVFDAWDGVNVWTRVREYPVSNAEKAGKQQATLVVRIGPAEPGGVLFSTHTDTVPADPKEWDTLPFILTEKNGNLYGRGTVDTKVNLVSNLTIASFFRKCDTYELIKKPIYFAFSWGEEIGCKGTDDVTDILDTIKATPELVVVGEPTGGKMVRGTKGGANLNINFQGIGGHSSQPEQGINANYQACRVGLFIEELDMKLRKDPNYSSGAFKPTYPVVNLGVMSGGTSSNTIAGRSRLEVHVRPTPGFDIDKQVIEPLKEFLRANIDAKMIEEEERIKGKGCEKKVGTQVIQLSYSSPLPVQEMTPILKNISDIHKKIKNTNEEPDTVFTVSFASEGGNILEWAKRSGQYSRDNLPTVIVYGEGDMGINGGHSPNEYVKRKELKKSMQFPLAAAASICLDPARVKNPCSIIVPTGSPEKACNRQFGQSL